MFIHVSCFDTDPIVSEAPAGVLDREAALSLVNTLIPPLASSTHIHSRPKSSLTWKILNVLVFLR